MKKTDYYIGFSRGNDLSSWAIGWDGAGYWSHAYTLLPGGIDVIDARSDKVGGQPPGVYVRPMSYLDDDERIVLKFQGDPEKIRKAHDLLLSQQKKPYDFSPGVIDIALGRLRKPGFRPWRDLSSWFCSELQIWGPETAELIPLAPFEVNRIVPGMAAYGWFQAGAMQVRHLEAGQRWTGLAP